MQDRQRPNFQDFDPGDRFSPRQLREAAQKVYVDNEPPLVTVRDFLSWFGAERRGKHVVRNIRAKLSKVKLVTIPDFEPAWIDGTIRLQAPRTIELAAKVVASSSVTSTPQVHVAPAHQLSKLPSAHLKTVRTIAPDASIDEAVTIMLNEDYSQLPVMTSSRDVKGVVSWKTIAVHQHIGKKCKFVRECMDAAPELPIDGSIFDAIDVVDKHGFVLVKDAEKKISGVITSHDVSVQFKKLTEPFLLLGEIENHIRNLIGTKFNKAELEEATDGRDSQREIKTVADLTLGEYLRLLENPARWERLSLSLERKLIIGDLEKVRRIRNDVMHFDPDGIADGDLETLRKFARLLSKVTEVTKRS